MATISRIVKFVPTIGGNDKAPDDERFEVKLRAVPAGKRQSQITKFIEMDPKKLMKQMMDARQQTEIKDLLKEHFVSFINFDVSDEATPEMVAEKKVGNVLGETRTLQVGDVFTRPATIEDIFELGEYELAMEIFMHMIGSSQLRKTIRSSAGSGGGELPEHGVEKEDEEKNSESPSGTTQIQNVH